MRYRYGLGQTGTALAAMNGGHYPEDSSEAFRKVFTHTPTRKGGHGEMGRTMVVDDCYTAGSPEGIAAVLAEVTDSDPYTFSLATWSEGNRAEFHMIVRAGRTDDYREAIFAAICGGGDSGSADRHERVSFVMGPDTFRAMVEALASLADSEDVDNDRAADFLSTVAQSVGVEWI